MNQEPKTKKNLKAKLPLDEALDGALDEALDEGTVEFKSGVHVAQSSGGSSSAGTTASAGASTQLNTARDLSELQAAANDAPFNENLLRPKSLAEYIGQKAVAAKLEVFMHAAKARSQVLDHVLLSGPPGLGKTTLAHIIAQEMGGRLHQAPGPTLEKSADLLSILSELKQGDVLFIDEIHRLHPAIEEALYPAMEDYEVQLIVGEGTSAQAITVKLEKFTLIGATTQPGKLTGPLRDRFGIPLNLDFYAFDEMCEILERSKTILGVKLSKNEIDAVAKRSRGTPRIANRLLARVRDFVEVMRGQNAGDNTLLSKRAKSVLQSSTPSSTPLTSSTQGLKLDPSSAVNSSGTEMVQWALEFLDVDHRGLQPLDRQYLRVLMGHFKGGPAGIEAIAASMSEDRGTLESIEPYLLKEGFVVRTARGRMATDLAYLHLGLEKPLSRPGEDLLLI